MLISRWTTTTFLVQGHCWLRRRGLIPAPAFITCWSRVDSGDWNSNRGITVLHFDHLNEAGAIADAELRSNHRYTLYIRSIEAKLALAEGRIDNAKAILNPLLLEVEAQLPCPTPLDR